MNNPCNECIVKIMCLDACDKIEMYVDERVKELMPVKVSHCSSGFLSAIGRKLRNQPNQDALIAHEKNLYNMIIEDGLIKKIFRKEKGIL